MKHLTIFVSLIIVSFLFFNCSSDDDTPSTEQLLQNRWFLVSEEVINPPNLTIADNCQQNSYFDFGSNNLMVLELFLGTPCESQGFQAFEYSLSANFQTITLNDSQNIDVWEIIEISNNQLILETNFGNRIFILSR